MVIYMVNPWSSRKNADYGDFPCSSQNLNDETTYHPKLGMIMVVQNITHFNSRSNSVANFPQVSGAWSQIDGKRWEREQTTFTEVKKNFMKFGGHPLDVI